MAVRGTLGAGEHMGIATPRREKQGVVSYEIYLVFVPKVPP